jgi:hypothetical protein
MQTYSEEVRAWLLGQFSGRRDDAVVTPTTSWHRKFLALLALPAGDAVIESALAAESRAVRLPSRPRRLRPGVAPSANCGK